MEAASLIEGWSDFSELDWRARQHVFIPMVNIREDFQCTSLESTSEVASPWLPKDALSESLDVDSKSVGVPLSLASFRA